MTSTLSLNDREVVDLEIDGVDSRDYPDFCDAFICAAVYADTGEALSDDDLIALQDKYPEIVHTMAFESLH
jgi:hypothetical protein